ncbi:MAG: DUF4833 domain-containing protein [Cytophagales bacterium]|nr:DUF4833 domain-containing protein [Cytophagales bacterium]
MKHYIIYMCLCSIAAYGQSQNTIFYIGTSEDKDIVCYDLNFDANGIQPQNPIDYYWIYYSKGGIRQEITWLQRKMAYGYEINEASKMRISIKVLSLKSKPVEVTLRNGKPEATTILNNKKCVLHHVYIVLANNALDIPDYALIYGSDINTGEQVIEKIKK